MTDTESSVFEAAITKRVDERARHLADRTPPPLPARPGGAWSIGELRALRGTSILHFTRANEGKTQLLSRVDGEILWRDKLEARSSYFNQPVEALRNSPCRK